MEFKFGNLTVDDWPNWNVAHEGNSFVTLEGQHLQKVFNKIHTQLETLRSLSAEQGEQIQICNHNDHMFTSHLEDLKATLTLMDKHIMNCQLENQQFKSMNSELLCRVNLQDEYISKIFQLLETQNKNYNHLETKLKELELQQNESGRDNLSSKISTPVTNNNTENRPYAIDTITRTTSPAASQRFHSPFEPSQMSYPFTNSDCNPNVVLKVSRPEKIETITQQNEMTMSPPSVHTSPTNSESRLNEQTTIQNLHKLSHGSGQIPFSSQTEEIQEPGCEEPTVEFEETNDELQEERIEINTTNEESLNNVTNPVATDDISALELPAFARGGLDPKLQSSTHSDPTTQILMEQLDQQTVRQISPSRPTSASTSSSHQLRYDILLSRVDNISKELEQYQQQTADYQHNTAEEIKLMKYKWNNRFQEMHDWILEHINRSTLSSDNDALNSNQSQEQLLQNDKIATFSIFQCPECYRLSKSTLTEEGFHLHSTYSHPVDIHSQTKRKNKLSHPGIHLPSSVNNSRECSKHRIDIKTSEVWWNMVQR